jgi:hypothetical protein
MDYLHITIFQWVVFSVVVCRGHSLFSFAGDDERVDSVAFNIAFQQVLNDLPHLAEDQLPAPAILSQLLTLHPNPKVDTLHLPIGHLLAIGLKRDFNASLHKWHYHPYARNGIPPNQKYIHQRNKFVLQPEIKVPKMKK